MDSRPGRCPPWGSARQSCWLPLSPPQRSRPAACYAFSPVRSFVPNEATGQVRGVEPSRTLRPPRVTPRRERYFVSSLPPSRAKQAGSPRYFAPRRRLSSGHGAPPGITPPLANSRPKAAITAECLEYARPLESKRASATRSEEHTSELQ